MERFLAGIPGMNRGDGRLFIFKPAYDFLRHGKHVLGSVADNVAVIDKVEPCKWLSIKKG